MTGFKPVLLNQIAMTTQFFFFFFQVFEILTDAQWEQRFIRIKFDFFYGRLLSTKLSFLRIIYEHFLWKVNPIQKLNPSYFISILLGVKIWILEIQFWDNQKQFWKTLSDTRQSDQSWISKKITGGILTIKVNIDSAAHSLKWKVIIIISVETAVVSATNYNLPDSIIPKRSTEFYKPFFKHIVRQWIRNIDNTVLCCLKESLRWCFHQQAAHGQFGPQRQPQPGTARVGLPISNVELWWARAWCPKWISRLKNIGLLAN